MNFSALLGECVASCHLNEDEDAEAQHAYGSAARLA